ncbi:AMP-binding protein [Neisseria viridiae]|uniref:AMP-binding protein n=1 Tax=Neisseria viridiae TaxID=2830648 RepID=UPI00272AD861|nr:AMP-binding protein [Neisseria viridiae]
MTRMFDINFSDNTPIAFDPLWTRADFIRTVHALSLKLKQNNIRSAALWFDDAALFAAALLAVWNSGGKALLLPNTAPGNLTWAKSAQILLTDTDIVSDGIHVWQIPTPCGGMPSENRIPQALDIPPESEVHLRTSGSGGEAKTIVKTAAQIESEARTLAAAIPFGRGKTAVLGSVSPQHMYGLTFRFALPLLMGWAMVRRQNAYPELLLSASLNVPSNYQNVWIASPALLNRFGENRDWAALNGRMAGIVSAGGELPPETAALLEQYAVRPYEVYGSTETGIIASRQKQTLWQPFPNVSIRNTGKSVEISSPWTGGVQHIADCIETHEDGFALLGRQDRIIKLADKRISLNQIEHELLKHPWIADAHCALHPEHGRIAVWAALDTEGITAWLEQGRTAVIAALKQHLAQTQDTAALPRYWRFTDRLPRNGQGKITAADFQTALAEPAVPQWHTLPPEGNRLRYQTRVPPDLPYFGGHFSTFPLVPGAVELEWVRRLAARHPFGRQNIIRIENLKYQQFIRPYDDISVELGYDADKNKLSFKIQKQDAACASGKLVFDTPQDSPNPAAREER